MAAGALAEVVTEEVAANLEEVAQATRALDTRGLSFFTGGLGTGFVIGFYFGHKWNKEKLRLEAFKESQEEVAAIRETYRRKEIVLADKPRLEEIVDEQGYSVKVDNTRPLPPPVPLMEPLPEPPVLQEMIETPAAVVKSGKDKNAGWSYPLELANRTPEAPYVIHQDEFKNSEHGYEQVTYTYWAGDDVLADEDNQPLVDAKTLVGTNNLKWGHGADDEDVVFVRNDKLNLEMEICRDLRSWEEHVGGSDPEDTLRHSSQSRPAPKRHRRTY